MHQLSAAGISPEWKFLVDYWAAANHCSLYPGSVIRGLKSELRGYDTSKGTLRFPAEKPLPATLVRKLVKRRMQRKCNQNPTKLETLRLRYASSRMTKDGV